MRVTRLGNHIGARVDGVDLRALDHTRFAAVERAFHEHGVIAISDQQLDEPDLIAFSRRFGALELNVASSFHHPDYPHVNILSNKRRADGTPMGSPDAAQPCPPDISYTPAPPPASTLYPL